MNYVYIGIGITALAFIARLIIPHKKDPAGELIKIDYEVCALYCDLRYFVKENLSAYMNRPDIDSIISHLNDTPATILPLGASDAILWDAVAERAAWLENTMTVLGLERALSTAIIFSKIIVLNERIDAHAFSHE